MNWQGKKSSSRARPPAPKFIELARELWWLLLVAATVYLALILSSYRPTDPGWSQTGTDLSVHNGGGAFGAWLSDLLFYLFGLSAWWWLALFLYGIWWGYRSLDANHLDRASLISHGAGFLLTLVTSSGVESLRLYNLGQNLPLDAGGLVGDGVGVLSVAVLGFTGGTLILLCLFAVGLSLFTGLSWLGIAESIGGLGETLFRRGGRIAEGSYDRYLGRRAVRARREPGSHEGEPSSPSFGPESDFEPEAEAPATTRSPFDFLRKRRRERTESVREPVFGEGSGEADVPTLDFPEAHDIPLADPEAPLWDDGDREGNMGHVRPPLDFGEDDREEAGWHVSRREERDLEWRSAAPVAPRREVVSPAREEEDFADIGWKNAESVPRHEAVPPPREEEDFADLGWKNVPPARREAEPVVRGEEDFADLGWKNAVPTPRQETEQPARREEGLADLGLKNAAPVPRHQVEPPPREEEDFADLGWKNAAPSARRETEPPPREEEGFDDLGWKNAASSGQAAPPAQDEDDNGDEFPWQGEDEPLSEAVAASAPRKREIHHPAHVEVHGEPGFPPLELLDQPDGIAETASPESLQRAASLIEGKLAEFGVSVAVRNVIPGPVITRFEIEPHTGVKGSQITNLVKDLARALSVVSIRVVETIPGKSYMGLELPNVKRQVVRLREILSADVYQSARSPLTLCLGKDISGKPMVADLARMPHLLVAGTTGSGKSVGINAMILSLLFRAMPDEVRLILIDPKMLELSVYEGIPHLLAPVVTDMNEASNALNWCVGEMEYRYRLMSALGVRNLAGYNQKIRDAEALEEFIPNPLALDQVDPEPLYTLPHIVVFIDELADLMMVVGKKVEQLIARLAQKARAAGIHLVLATQRPSVDVITGLIKANVPTRVAFQVSSKIDSRTILDQMGAETLLGQGDMLFLPPGTSLPQRVHGAFVDDNEVHRVVEYCKTHLGEADYVPGVLEFSTEESSGGGGEGGRGAGDPEDDPLYDDAVAIVLKTRRASISAVQRQLRIGYNRAARLIEAMEGAGIVSPVQARGNREVLVPDREGS